MFAILFDGYFWLSWCCLLVLLSTRNSSADLRKQVSILSLRILLRCCINIRFLQALISFLGIFLNALKRGRCY